jgi:hypothetical protein
MFALKVELGGGVLYCSEWKNTRAEEKRSLGAPSDVMAATININTKHIYTDIGLCVAETFG